MQKKLIAVAVAGLLSAPVFAQTNVTISGVLNAGFENIHASGGSVKLATNPTTGAGGIPSHNRIVDNSSEVRFTVEEDLGGGLKAFGTVGNQVDMGHDHPTGGRPATSLWGSRNTGVGLRSSKWGEIVMGRWDVQWHTLAGVDSHWIKGAGANGVTGGSMTMGRGARAVAQGGRLSNTVRYTSPSWNGFNVTAYYSRLSAENPLVTTVAGHNEDSKDTVWSITPMYNNGPWHAVYSYYHRNDQRNTAATTSPILGAIGEMDTRGHRAGVAYSFAMGLKVGIFWDQLKAHESADVIATGTGSAKRTVWGIPVEYTTGPHTFGIAYAHMGDIHASASVAATNTAVKLGDNSTGAHMWSLGYQYALSKRTNLWVNYARINNERNAAYDFGANNAIGLGAGVNGGTGTGIGALAAGATPAGNAGADPRTFGVGIRHVF